MAACVVSTAKRGFSGDVHVGPFQACNKRGLHVIQRFFLESKRSSMNRGVERACGLLESCSKLEYYIMKHVP